ncbi:MAG: tetratricopeptide repeat protein [Pseudomonadota bacterium]
MKTLAIFLLCLFLSACATSLPPPPSPLQLADDSRFGPPNEAINPEELFTLSPEMRNYVRSPVFANHIRNKGERGLIEALYQKGELKLEYDSSRTRNAAETFAAKSGNCLSLVIMTAAIAKELNMQVFYQNVMVDETWSRKNGLYFASTHVNLTFGRRSTEQIHSYDAGITMLTVDFLPAEDVAGYRTHTVDEGTLIAMYMNNKAAEAIAQDRLNDAYWWARRAAIEHPAYITAYNTLGVVYQRHGDHALAERAFRLALEREPQNLVTMQNLVPVLTAQGKTVEAKALQTKIASIEPFPPFYYFDLGTKAMAAHDWAKAKTLFSKEVARMPYYHEFHFWLGLSMFMLGEQGDAREQLNLAIETSTSPDNRNRYAAKLAHLRSLAPNRFN